MEPTTSFTTWAAARERSLLRTAFLLTGDLHRAEDLVQDAFIKVALRWSRLVDGNPDAYARTVIVRSNVSWWRRTRRERVVPDVPDTPSGGGDSGDVDRRLVLRRALARLTPKQRAVIVLRFYEDLSEPQVAATLGVSVGTVKSQTAAALARLRTAAPELTQFIGGMSS